MHAYQAYGDSVFFDMANTIYDYASKFVISYNDTTPTNRNKQFTVAVQCNGGSTCADSILMPDLSYICVEDTMAGGVFWVGSITAIGLYRPRGY